MGLDGSGAVPPPQQAGSFCIFLFGMSGFVFGGFFEKAELAQRSRHSRW